MNMRKSQEMQIAAACKAHKSALDTLQYPTKAKTRLEGCIPLGEQQGAKGEQHLCKMSSGLSLLQAQVKRQRGLSRESPAVLEEMILETQGLAYQACLCEATTRPLLKHAPRAERGPHGWSP